MYEKSHKGTRAADRDLERYPGPGTVELDVGGHDFRQVRLSEPRGMAQLPRKPVRLGDS